jgi:hypothetical protein
MASLKLMGRECPNSYSVYGSDSKLIARPYSKASNYGSG